MEFNYINNKMNFYLDTEFLEGPQSKRIFGLKTGFKTKPTIDLISIGIVSEDNREYYAISKDFNLEEAWNRYDLKSKRINHAKIPYRDYWIRENVLKPIFEELYSKYIEEVKSYKNQKEFEDYFINIDNKFTFKNVKKLLNKYGKSNDRIAYEVKSLVYTKINIWGDNEPINFYTYYGDYDWVVFCWLFGKMNDLPKRFPMYSRDLKQLLDSKLESKNYTLNDLEKTNHGITRLLGLEEKLKYIKQFKEYPLNKNNHNALADAKWNKNFHNFIYNL